MMRDFCHTEKINSSLFPRRPGSNGDSTPAARMRAIVEIIGGELSIIPIASTDREERDVLDALRIGEEPRQ
jgi:hypothetical protein